MDHDVVWMHDLPEEMDKNIFFQECPSDPGKRSRLWVYKDIEKVYRKNKVRDYLEKLNLFPAFMFKKFEILIVMLIIFFLQIINSFLNFDY